MALLQIAEPGQSTNPHEHKLAVGIDLGTTNSLVASVRSGLPEVLADEDGNKSLPSAVQYLQDSILKNIEPVKSQLALGFIRLKSGQVAAGSKEIKNVTDMFPEEVYKYYPIKVSLKESLFDSKKAQKSYRKNVEKSKFLNYQKIFYFSPYKVFNANSTISYIRKGTASIYIDNIASAKNYLSKSTSSSSVNKGIIKAIKKALTFHIRDANNELRELVKIQPKHSILHYNLGLTYAQMGNMIDAHKHFIRSYHHNKAI